MRQQGSKSAIHVCLAVVAVSSSSAEEFLTSATHRMTQRQLVDLLRSPLALHDEFWVSNQRTHNAAVILSAWGEVQLCIWPS